MIAHLGMYDVPRPSDLFWRHIRAALGHGPENLTMSTDYWAIWTAPDLLFAQTCGYPYRARLHPHAALIGTPDYGLPGCPPGFYRSLFVKRAADPRADLPAMAGARFAYNEPLSQSGWAAPVLHLLAEDVRPGALLETGAHAASLRAVLDGRADFAGLDALSFALLEARGAAAGAQVFAQTEPGPGLPYITGPEGDPEALFAATRHAIAALPDAARAALHLRGLAAIPAETYLALPAPPPPAEFLRSA